ncbi:YfbM family protein [Treponema sp. OMZ 792]|uniref:YfbM family protein n=1 Tax=unclassified Treponema TaxID=2638727 RepID=UPI0020A4EAF0|nr:MULTISPECIES: YfbM family protein [unclassified Treponema]UTC66562.1 YfbM family protein [Treponema sp. OMZ 789]UTC69294.1 YfbM family protein [Treponema sp. OMZ 790]UTC72008.1 YfbM family protein [Treponema sp. OMZ 791]UTC74694.1 YfbM family protein [Treponema sp. OMZ 792]UTC76985.1 YfbM family protein [Treponema sp. OMZ 799]
MGMIANYQYLSDENLKQLKSFNAEEDEIFENVEEWNEEAKLLLDIDKMWDALHFVLTGIDSSKPIENDPLSEAVVGVSPIDGIEDFIAYTEKSRIKDIISALDNFDIEKAMNNFSMKECKKADLYPNIWDYEEEADEIKEELTDCFQNMKEFYKQVLEADGNVLVTIY